MLIPVFVLSTLVWLVADAKVDFRHSATNKDFISRLPENQFEIVHPFQIRDKNERIGIDTRNYFLNATVHYQHVTIVIRSNTLVNHRLKLVLNLNDYLFFNQTKFNKLDANGESPINGRVENCYYQGTVNSDATSFVAISTCTGLRGIIAFENGTTYGLWPLDGGDRGRRHPHVLYKTQWPKEFTCGSITQNLAAQFLRKKRDVSRQTKYVELAVIGDKSFVTEHGLSQDEAVQYMLESVNIADLMLARDLNIRLSVAYSELWIDAQRVDMHDDIERTLSGVHDYVTGHIYHIGKDATLMFTGASFASHDGVSSMFSSICTSRAVGLVKVRFSQPCLQWIDELPADRRQPVAASVKWINLWSSNTLRLAAGLSFFAGHLDERLDGNKDCHRCELRKSGTICRESRSICDVLEFCDGESGDCPADGYLVDGIICGIKSQCWKGNCSDPEQQCKALWGPGYKA
uniref:Peptidase M12B domain-containing protein n=1 Tax=Panagrellus redivivus TaxID=6233 RepID=A0A7E4VRT4_PANRE